MLNRHQLLQSSFEVYAHLPSFGGPSPKFQTGITKMVCRFNSHILVAGSILLRSFLAACILHLWVSNSTINLVILCRTWLQIPPKLFRAVVDRGLDT